MKIRRKMKKIPEDKLEKWNESKEKVFEMKKMERRMLCEIYSKQLEIGFPSPKFGWISYPRKYPACEKRSLKNVRALLDYYIIVQNANMIISMLNGFAMRFFLKR